jgi:DsbC/DsbD-like thiol-disulfide interchange protein
MKKFLWLVVIVGLAISCTKSEPAQTEPPEPPRINSVDVVKANPQEITLTRGESGAGVIKIQIAHGYHVNANPPSQPYLKPTEIVLTPAEGISLESVNYPEPLIRKFSFSETPLKVYEGDSELQLNIKADKSATAGKHNLSAKLRVQACDDKVCYAPGALDVIVPVNIK